MFKTIYFLFAIYVLCILILIGIFCAFDLIGEFNLFSTFLFYLCISKCSIFVIFTLALFLRHSRLLVEVESLLDV